MLLLVGLLFAPSLLPLAARLAAAGQQANVPTSQKVIKDPAEYNDYITALRLAPPLTSWASSPATRRTRSCSP
jgi:hypothetical protein